MVWGLWRPYTHTLHTLTRQIDNKTYKHSGKWKKKKSFVSILLECFLRVVFGFVRAFFPSLFLYLFSSLVSMLLIYCRLAAIRYSPNQYRRLKQYQFVIWHTYILQRLVSREALLCIQRLHGRQPRVREHKDVSIGIHFIAFGSMFLLLF